MQLIGLAEGYLPESDTILFDFIRLLQKTWITFDLFLYLEFNLETFGINGPLGLMGVLAFRRLRITNLS